MAMKNGPQNKAAPASRQDDGESPAASEPSTARRGTLRVLVAVAIGLLGSVAIWFASPYNTFVMRSQYIADSFLPISFSSFARFFLTSAIRPGGCLWPCFE